MTMGLRFLKKERAFWGQLSKSSSLTIKGRQTAVVFRITGLEHVNQNVFICDVIIDIRQSFLSDQ